MTIIYALVGTERNVVLCEFTRFSGNFQQIARVLLKNLARRDTDFTRVSANGSVFYYINTKGLVFLCMTEQRSETVSYSFLKEIKAKFLMRYERKYIESLQSYQLKDFESVIKNYMVLF